jgi:hypothetical protein
MRNKVSPRGERPPDIRKHMDWWRSEARFFRTSSRATEIRAGELITRLLDAIEREG